MTKSLPNWLKLTFAGVRMVSFRFCPVLARSLYQVRTSTAKMAGAAASTAENKPSFRNEIILAGSTLKKLADRTPFANNFTHVGNKSHPPSATIFHSAKRFVPFDSSHRRTRFCFRHRQKRDRRQRRDDRMMMSIFQKSFASIFSSRS